MDSKKKAVQFFKSVLRNVNPSSFLPDIVRLDNEKNQLIIQNHTIQLDGNRPVYVIGTGKASSTMAAAMEQLLRDRLRDGMIIAPPDSEDNLNVIKLLTGAHPLPDERSFSSSQKLLKFIDSIPEGSVVLYLLSGGTSSLFSLPIREISNDDLRTVFELLLQSGASIQEVNSVRRTLSQIKGGRLLQHLRHTTLTDIIISDVPDDDLRYIGSGPTTPQQISYKEAQHILTEYGLLVKVPKSVKTYLATQSEREKLTGEIFSTTDFENHKQLIVSSASLVAEKFGELLMQDGYAAHVINPAWSGMIDDYEDHILLHLEKALEQDDSPQALIFYGECTVKVSGNGLGGRNQELALRMAKKLYRFKRNITFLSAGTDGIDGPTDAAGAVVDQLTYEQAVKNDTDPDSYLEKNDSYRFFEKEGGHIVTGPTGNNVMDLQLLLID